ncbi:MAG: tRNA (guanosine(37)-N1)-methyltransferase TrmD [Chloroflexi bacterium]|nr:tRNA (guanosine(37)-N1)-methyltransferase TrmD [Chloroflexota bacterium]
MDIHILTLFPAMFQGPFAESIVRRAADKGLVTITLHQVRDYATDRHRTVDDYSYGGGPGMVMKPEPLFAAGEDVWRKAESRLPTILLTPQGRLFNQDVADELAKLPGILLICGHYEGVDERVHRHLADDEISIGDYVLTGGELAAMVVVDALVRLLPGALSSQQSIAEDSLRGGLLQHPLYTRPADFRGWEVPAVLLSGNHQEVARWRRRQALLRTLKRRPDLLARAEISAEEHRWLESAAAGELTEEPPPG